MTSPEVLPSPLQRAFRLIAFDWDGTAVANRVEDAAATRAPIERLLESGVPVVVVTGTNFKNVDRQLSAEIRGPAKRDLFLAVNRGSEVYGFDARGAPERLAYRQATPAEEQSLSEIAEAVRLELLERFGLEVAVVSDRLNRRKIDLVPLPAFRDPPKSALGELLSAVEARLARAGVAGGLREVFALVERVAAEKLPSARITSDVKHVEIGLTDKGDSIVWVMRELAERRGIPREEILVGGDEFGPIAGFPGSDHLMVVPDAAGAVFVSVGPEPAGMPSRVIHLGGGPERFRALLRFQASLHPLSLPARPTEDPSWLMVEEGFRLEREHEIESLLALGNGLLGSRASVPEGTRLSAPATFAAGIFQVFAPRPIDVPELVKTWNWSNLTIAVEGEPLQLEAGEILKHRRTLDLRQGVLWREWRHRDPAGRITRVKEMRLLSQADRHALVQSVRMVPENYSGRVQLLTTLERPPGTVNLDGLEAEDAGPLRLSVRTRSGAELCLALSSRVAAQNGRRIERRLARGEDRAVELWEFQAEVGRSYRLDRVGSLFTSRASERPGSAAAEHLDSLLARGIAALFEEHVSAWKERWQAADIQVRDDPFSQRALRFAAYHLLAASNPDDERISIGARALTGEGYKGHVFWETEIYMLPFFCLSHPAAARALLMYRWHCLPAARAKAARLGWRGALYAWESADGGEDVTPSFVLSPDGELVRIHVAEQEQHVSADVAFGVFTYWTMTGDDTFFLDAGAEMAFETARFWASRVERGEDGLHHVCGVIGPDEYHESVDDDAFTNGMASWNLEFAARAARTLARRWPEAWEALSSRLGFTAEEVESWERLSRAIYTGFDPGTGLFEQFRGYYGLEEIDLRELEPRNAPVEVILGRERVGRSKLVKQPDVVMLLYLLWDRFTPEVRAANFRYYEPRTGHGSSLSPPIHAAFAARLGDLECARRYFRQTAEIDLANNMGNAAGGVHAGALGGLWQAAVFGFAGMELVDGAPVFSPRLPESWSRMHINYRWGNRAHRVSLDAAAGRADRSRKGEEVIS